MTRFLMRRLQRRNDEGFAMLSVLFVMLILTTLGSLLLLQAVNGLPENRHEVSYQAALGAAESGVDDFIDRLDQNYNYATSLDSNKALTQYVPVAPGSSASYTYTVDTSQIINDSGTNSGTILLTAKGKVGNVVRTVKVGLRPFGFLDALSNTNYNTVDPALFQVNGWTAQQTADNCSYYAWQTRTAGTPNPYIPGSGAPVASGTGPDSHCSSMLNYYITGNVLDGPMHSNDDFYLCGKPEFDGPVSSGDPSTVAGAKFWKDPAGCGGDAPQFKSGGAITGNQRVNFPPSNAAVKTWALTGSSTGCLYTGPTAITLSGSTMTVVSPDTKSTNSNCVGTNVPLPADGVIYDQTIPGAGDPNNGPCNLDLSSWAPYPGYQCGNGDVFIQGTTSGQLTVAAENDVVVTGDLKYTDINATNPRPVLGLIANNTVLINHPVSGGNNVSGTVPFGSTGVTFSVPLINPTIQAAILSVNHSMAVPYFNQGSPTGLGAVNVLGSIAEYYMDITGQFSGSGTLAHGYDVNYHYDQRFLNGGLVPPHFLDPTQTYWHRVSFTECASGSTCT